MLTLILSTNLKLRFISPDTSVSFRPHPAHLDHPIEIAQGLREVDPGLSLDCRSALRGEPVISREIRQPGGETYLRKVMVRPIDDGQAEELIVTYEAGVSAPRLELAEIRVRMADALDAVQDPFAYFDKHDCLVHFNRAYAQLHDNPEGEIIVGMRFEDVVRRNLRSGLLGISADQHDQWLSDRLAQSGHQTFEEELRFHDGRWFRVTERSTAGGSRVHLLVDITDLKIAQVALQQVIFGSQAATWNVNLETGESDVNDLWAEMLGFDKQAVASIGLEGWRKLVHPDDLDVAEAGFVQCAEGTATTFEAEYRLRHQYGHWIWVMGRGGISDRHADGRPCQISGVLLDISCRKEMETELAMKAAAVEATEDGVTITDEAGTILYTNPAHATMIGHYDPASLTDQPWHSLYSSQAAARLAATAFPALRDDGYWSGQVEALRADGTTFEQELSLTEMPDGKIICMNRNVSARNAIARERVQIRERIELAQRQEIINLLAAGLTHDLVNLIMLISHFSDPALGDARGKLPNSIENIHSTARQAIALLEPIRSLGLEKRETDASDLADLLKEATGILQLGAPHNLKITIDLPDDPIIATVDPLKLMQVLLNLGLNGRDALGDGKHEIAFSLSFHDNIPQTANLEVGDIPDTPFALFTISDTGTGITPQVRARLWEPHFTTKGHMGTGLGLPVIAEIMREIGGAIALESTPGVGTSFYVAWPLTYPVVQKRKFG